MLCCCCKVSTCTVQHNYRKNVFRVVNICNLRTTFKETPGPYSMSMQPKSSIGVQQR
uniref:Uncharacterized protein n=1 Tax=Arundo donax TaxID=35708 RepID=A0A0A9CGD9_ARUDO